MRLRAGVAEGGFLDVGPLVGPGFGETRRLVEEVLDERGAVVLLDEVDERLGEVVFFRQVDAVLDVADDDEGAHGRGEMLVAAFAAGGDVLDEVLGLEHLADIVEVGSHADEKAVGADRFGGGFGDAGDGDRVVVGAGSAADEFLQERVRGIAELEEADVGHDAEQLFDERQAAGHEVTREQAPHRAGGTQLEQRGMLQDVAERLGLHDADAHADDEMGDGREDADLDERGPRPDAGDGNDGRGAGADEDDEVPELAGG